MTRMDGLSDSDDWCSVSSKSISTAKIGQKKAPEATPMLN